MARNASPKNSTKTQQNKHKKTKKATTQNGPELTTTPSPSGVVCAGTRDGAAWTPPPPGAVRARASRTSAVIDIGSLTVPSSGFGVAGQRSSAGRPTSRPGPDVALPAFGERRAPHVDCSRAATGGNRQVDRFRGSVVPLRGQVSR